MKKKRAALLCRVSTGSQQNDRQVSELLVLAESQGYLVEPDDIYEDTISGLTRWQERPSLNRLFQNIKKKQKDYSMVFVHEVSRISRKVEEGEKIMLEFAELGMPVFVKNINMCTHDEKGTRNPFFKIVYTLLQEFSASEVDYIKQRSKSGIRQSVRNGGSGGGVFKAYGYKNENKKLVLAEEEVPTVEWIFDMAEKGYGLNTICNVLNEHAVPTKSQKVVKKGTIVTKGSGTAKLVKETKHVRWEAGTVQTMLTNEIYKGVRKFRIGEDENGKPIFETTTAPVIIDPARFDKIQATRREKFNTRSREMRYMYLLKGICTCGVCGRNMAGRYKPGTDMYYQCSSKRHTNLNCGNTSPNIEALEATVWTMLKDSHKTLEHLMSTGDKMKKARDKREVLENDLKFTTSELVDIEKERERMKTMFKRGIISEDELIKDFERVDRSLKLKKAKLDKTQKQLKAVSESMVMLSNMDRYMAWAKREKLSRYEIAEIINNVLERVTVTAVDRHGNCNRFIVSVYWKDLLPPFTVLMVTKERHHQNKTFMTEKVQMLAGQSRFKFVELTQGLLHHVKYSDQGALVTPAENVVEMIMDQRGEDWTYYSGRIHQHNFHGQVFEASETLGEDYDAETILETVPVYLPFEEANAIEDVKKIKMQQRRKEAV